MPDEVDSPLAETGTCYLCGDEYTHFGNNPEPLADFEQRVCDECNWQKVVPARMGREEGSLGPTPPAFDAETQTKTRLIQETFGSVDEAHRNE